MYNFIINPHSRSGLGQHIWKSIEPILKERDVEYTAFFTKYQGHATKEVARLTADCMPVTLIVLGGDGTINEVVNGITHLSRVTLGYIPTGSSNDFARGFGMSSDPLECLEHILNPTVIQPMDVGVLMYKNKRRRFCVSCGIGFDAAICHEAVVSKVKLFLNKIHFGKLTYVGIALHQLFMVRRCTSHITLNPGTDSESSVDFSDTWFIAIMNHRYEGGGFMFAPNSKIDDGLLNICSIHQMSIPKLLTLLPTAYGGHHIHFKGVYNNQCQTIDIQTDLPLAVHTDGEPVFLQRHIRVSCEEEQMQVIVS